MRPPESIYVAVPSYRDSRCSATLASLFEKADRPDLVWCAVLDQSSGVGEECCAVPQRHASQCRHTRIQYCGAKGPLYARQLLYAMYGGESFFMMIDAHSTFSAHWDTRLKAEYRHLKYHIGVPRPVISAYSAPTMAQQQQGIVHHLCSASPLTNGMLYPGRTRSISVNSGAFKRTAYLSCHYAFSEGSLCEVFSRSLRRKGITFRHVFWGEEGLLACIAYVYGYDVYTPPAVHLVHAYAPSDVPKRSWRNDVGDVGDLRKNSEATLQAILDPFGTPTQPQLRSVRGFWKAAGFTINRGQVPVQTHALCTR